MSIISGLLEKESGIDSDEDGNPNKAEYDKDEDGKIDVIAYDYDQDGEWDKFENV